MAWTPQRKWTRLAKKHYFFFQELSSIERPFQLNLYSILIFEKKRREMKMRDQSKFSHSYLEFESESVGMNNKHRSSSWQGGFPIYFYIFNISFLSFFFSDFCLWEDVEKSKIWWKPGGNRRINVYKLAPPSSSKTALW